MPLRSEQTPAGPRWMGEQIAKIWRAIAELRAARRLENATIGAGGLTVQDGGGFKVKLPSGLSLVFAGQMRRPDFDHVDGSPQQGFFVAREDGSVALGVYAIPSVAGVDTQAVQLFDRTGNQIVSEDTTAGVGLALPYLPLPFTTARYTDWPGSTSATFEDVHRATFKKMQPWAYVSVGSTTDVSGTTGEFQLTINGTAYGTPTAVAFAQAGTTIGPFQLPGNFKDQVELRIQARRTAGTGAVRCQVIAASGLQS